MKRTLCLFVGAAALGLCGCSGEPEVTTQDKANLDRLSKEGIGKVMADQAAKEGKAPPSLANPDGGPGPAAQTP